MPEWEASDGRERDAEMVSMSCRGDPWLHQHVVRQHAARQHAAYLLQLRNPLIRGDLACLVNVSITLGISRQYHKKKKQSQKNAKEEIWT